MIMCIDTNLTKDFHNYNLFYIHKFLSIFFYECHKMILIYQIYIVLLCVWVGIEHSSHVIKPKFQKQIHNLYDTWQLCDGGTILQKSVLIFLLTRKN